MNPRLFPGVRCSTLNTWCRSLLCIMTAPGRSRVAVMAMNTSPKVLLDDSPPDRAAQGGAQRQEQPTDFTRAPADKAANADWGHPTSVPMDCAQPQRGVMLRNRGAPAYF